MSAVLACGTQPTENMLPDSGGGQTPVDASIDAPSPPADAGPCVPPTGGSAPTYTQIYNQYLANTCGRSGCHRESGNGGWTCGTTKDSCYRGMVSKGLINNMNPPASRLADPATSPLRWVNPRGGMPQGALQSNDAARDAIIAWANACAQNN